MGRYSTPDDNSLVKLFADHERRLKSLESGNRIGFTSIDNGQLVDNTSSPSTAIGGSGSSAATATQTIPNADTDATGAYDDLITVGPSFNVVIGQGARALVLISVNIHMVVNAADTNFGFMSFTMTTGGTTFGPSDSNAAGVKIANANASAITVDLSVSKAVPMLGLPAGTYTVTAKYSGGTGAGGAVTFSARSLTVMPY